MTNLIKIYTGSEFLPEKKYITHLIFDIWLGLKSYIYVEERKNYKIETATGFFFLPDYFFSVPENWFLTKNHLTFFEKYIDVHDPQNIDIFGLIFFCITRYEEACIKSQDIHERFDFSASILFKKWDICSPIANYLLEILWERIKQICPNFKRKKRNYNVSVSHDVDFPYAFVFSSFKSLIRETGRSLIHHREPLNFFKIPLKYMMVKTKKYEYDPFYTFDFLMQESEKRGLISTFYFLAGGEHKYDGRYPIDHPATKHLLLDVHRRGHKIGLHGSYNSFNNLQILKEEKENLEKVLMDIGIDSPITQARQHYLRFDILKTSTILNQVGIKMDSTLGFASQVGFRAGTCYEFPMYDLLKREKMNLWQQPLIVMEGSLLHYMKKSYKDSLEVIKYLSDQCRKYNGTFTLLWHNTSLLSRSEKKLYKDVLRII